MSVQFIVHGEDAITLLQSLELTLSPLGLMAFMEGPLAFYMEGQVEERFMQEGDEMTGKWAPLAAATQAIREALGYGAAHPINVRTGDLYEFVRYGAAYAEPFGAVYVMPERPATGELAEKMDLAQNGGVSDGGSAVPARPVLAVDRGMFFDIITMLEQHIVKGGSIF